jgi:hypothetical protein
MQKPRAAGESIFGEQTRRDEIKEIAFNYETEMANHNCRRASDSLEPNTVQKANGVA